jgi:3-phytase
MLVRESVRVAHLLAVAFLFGLLASAGLGWARDAATNKVVLPGVERLTVESQGLVLQDGTGKRLAELTLRAKHLDQRQTPGGVLATVMDADTQQVWFVDASARQLSLVRRATVASPSWSVAAVCQYRDPQGIDQVFILGEEGQAEQWVLRGSEPLLLRRLSVPPNVRHCIVDDPTERLFVLEEGQGVSAFVASAEATLRRWTVGGTGEQMPRGMRPWAGGIALLDASGKATNWSERDGRYASARTSPDPTPQSAELPVVMPRAQTEPVARHGDAADDPAIWVHPTEPARSLVLGTNKKQGLLVYDLQGRQRQLLEVGRVNNVDLRQRVRIDGRERDLAVATHRDEHSIVVFEIDTQGVVSEVGRIPTGLKDIYGVCLHQPSHGGLEVFVNDKDGTFQRHRLTTMTGRVAARLVQHFKISSQPEACVADDPAGVLYLGEEKRGVWAMPLADERARPDLTLVTGIETENGKNLVPDVEGLALYAPTSGEPARYLVVSSQGNDSYLVFDASAPYAPRGAFRIGMNLQAGIDGASETDGLEVTARALGPNYPRGMLVVQDGRKRLPDGPQNFKIVDWRDIAQVLKLP